MNAYLNAVALGIDELIADESNIYDMEALKSDIVSAIKRDEQKDKDLNDSSAEIVMNHCEIEKLRAQVAENERLFKDMKQAVLEIKDINQQLIRV